MPSRRGLTRSMSYSTRRVFVGPDGSILHVAIDTSRRGRNIKVLAGVSTAGVFGQMLYGELTDVAHLSRTCRLSAQAILAGSS